MQLKQSLGKKPVTAATMLVAFFAISLISNFFFCPPAFSEGKGTLWEVRNGDKRAYLVGSIHMLKPENYPLEESFEKAFATADIVVFEADLDRLKEPATQQMILKKAFASEGKPLSTVLGQDAWERASKKAREVGISLATMENFQPWFVCNTVTVLKMVQMGFRPEYGLDSYFFEKAKKQNKEIMGLETPAEQIDFLAGLPASQQKAFFVQTMDELDQFDESVNDLVRSWEEGNIAELENLLMEGFRSHQDVYDRIVKQRNINWMGKIDILLNSEQPALIVVGAAHLLGEDGLVAMLKDKGYQVRQL